MSRWNVLKALNTIAMICGSTVTGAGVHSADNAATLGPLLHRGPCHELAPPDNKWATSRAAVTILQSSKKLYQFVW